MQFKKIVSFIVFIILLYNCDSQITVKQAPQILPMPSHIDSQKGEFILDNSAGITFDKSFKVSATFLKEFIENGSSIRLKQNNAIRFIKDESITNEEGYQLTIAPKQIEIKAKTDHGAFYAVQSLRQLLPVGLENSTFSQMSVSIPSVTIKDSPQFSYRGMHLDVGRHFYSVEFIKKYIDALAMLKMNTFHWHLTEDQGWRIEIKKYPKLQEIAAFRDQTLVGSFNNDPQFDGKRYGGFYTQEEIKDVVAYAQARHVTIIPEIEMPGHAQAAISAYPELGCTGEQIKVAETWGVFHDIYCSKDETFEFLENVLDEVLELFPSKYIHIGGDEAPKTHWEKCPNCQQRIKDEGLKNEHELQNYFITRIEKYLNSKGRQIIGWDEILEGGLAPNATVMSWRGTQGAVEAAKQHHNVIMTPTSHCYFDYKQSDNADEPLANSGGFLPLEKVYSFNPIPEQLSEEEARYVLGAQGNLWTEYISTEKQVEYMLFPRIIAMSEVVWSPTENKNYPDFIARLEQFHKRLDALDINYANHLYEVEGEPGPNGYELKTMIKNKTIRYTTDGTAPTINSVVYSEAIPITKNLMIKAAVFNSEKRLGAIFKQPINYHKALGKKITINAQPSKTYTGSGIQGLVNGISGSDTRVNDKEWLGFNGVDLEITIDLGEEMEVKTIETRFYQAPWQWIYAPKHIEFGVEQQGINSNIKLSENDGSHLNVSLKLNETTRYIYLKIPNSNLIPEGKPGAGHKPWTFIDEIIIN